MLDASVILEMIPGRLEAVFRSCVPLLAAAMAGILSERSGTINIALEGGLLISAFAAGAVGAATGSAYMGLAAAMGCGVLYHLFYAQAVVKLRADAIITGTGFNLLMAALTPFLCLSIYGTQSGTPSLASDQKFNPVVFGQFFLGIVTLLSPFVLHFLFKKTTLGIRLRAAGENTGLVHSLGLSLNRIRFSGLMLGGIMLGVGGGYLALCTGSGFVRNMSSGLGFLGIAALICGGWRPLPTLAFSLLFAFVDVLQTELSQVTFAFGRIPNALSQSLPYLVGLTVLVISGQKTRAPHALGEY